MGIQVNRRGLIILDDLAVLVLCGDKVTASFLVVGRKSNVIHVAIHGWFIFDVFLFGYIRDDADGLETGVDKRVFQNGFERPGNVRYDLELTHVEYTYPGRAEATPERTPSEEGLS